MNVKLLKQVRDYIKTHPEKYDQSRWCGSACCVAGTTVVVSKLVKVKDMRAAKKAEWDRYVGEVNVEVGAQRALGLDDDQAERLFGSTWAEVSTGQFWIDHLEHTAKQRAVIAVKRINHFIKTKGAE